MGRHIFTLSLLGLILTTGCTSKTKKTTMPPLAVEITLARAKSLKEKISFSSQIESLYDATIEPRIDGYLISAPYSYGEIISKGDIIFTIDPKQLNTTLYAIEAEL
ncbi:MAG: biotin/lipoyl-binding protein, partial [Rikenellaceae bacterium]